MAWLRRLFEENTFEHTVRLGFVGWVVGMAIHATDEQRWVFILPLFFIACMAVGAAFFLARKFLWIAVFIAICIGAIWRYDIALPSAASPPFPQGKQIILTGRIIDGPRDTPDGSQIKLDRVRDRTQPLNATSFTLTIRALTHAQLGDIISWQCFPQWSPQFPYSGRCTPRDSPHVIKPTSSLLAKGLFALRTFMSARARAIMPDPEASFLLGLLIGDDFGMPREVLQSFRLTGLSHIVAVSGYNVAWVVTVFIFIACFFGLHRRRAAFAVTLFVWLFVAVVGTQASVVRAAIMGTMQLLAVMIGRKYSSAWALVYAAAIMLAIDPLYLRHDIGFQLSFIAVFALQWFAPALEEKVFSKLPSFTQKLFLETFAVTLVTFPYMLFRFGYFSATSLLVNALVLPFIPFATGFGAVALVLGMIAKSLGLVFASIPFLLLHIVLSIVALFSKVPLLVSLPITLPVFLLLNICVALLWYAMARAKPKPLFNAATYDSALVVEKTNR